MKFIDFKQDLKDFIVFNLQDIRKLEADFDLRRLSEWQDKGYLQMVRKGYYIFSDLPVNEQVLFLMANKVYSPSYVSLEMALSYYNLIPESVYGVTSVSSEKTSRFKTDLGEFIYRHIKPELLFGYQLVEYQNHNFKIAEIEKALLDYLYLNPRLKTDSDFSELRFKVDEFKERANKKKLIRYLEAFNSQSLAGRVKKFLKFINYHYA